MYILGIEAMASTGLAIAILLSVFSIEMTYEQAIDHRNIAIMLLLLGAILYGAYLISIFYGL